MPAAHPVTKQGFLSAFTLLELLIVVIILGILASLGAVQYTKVIEKGRGAEARSILGQIRTAEEAYRLEYDTYTSTATVGFSGLGIDSITNDLCDENHYFKYTVTGADSDSFSAKASRCEGTDGKDPGIGTGSSYNITLDQNGTLTVPAGY